MKIFIIHASAGHGHKMVAEAIKEFAVDSYGADSVKLLDILDFTSSFYRTIYSKGYIFCISKLKRLWAILFFLSDTKYLGPVNNNFRRFTNKIFCRKFIKFLKSEKPDVIISTHFLVNELVSALKENKELNSKLISVVTDFGVHNFWIAKNVDVYAAGCEKTREILLSKGVQAQRIKVSGIPIRKQFQRSIEKNQVRQRLNLHPDGFTVLILTGGIGIGPIEQIVRQINDRINVIVICGNNKKLYGQLNDLGYQRLSVLGWVDQIEEVMSVSNLVITKPGGSTITECLSADLPMIFFSIIPGQEFHNAKIISEYNLGLIIENPQEIAEKILFFRENSAEAQKIRDRMRSFKITGSANRVLSLINE